MKAGDELDMEPRIEVINAFLGQQINHCSAFVEGMDLADVDGDVLDELFREIPEDGMGDGLCQGGRNCVVPFCFLPSRLLSLMRRNEMLRRFFL
jgi:hypothetical protein